MTWRLQGRSRIMRFDETLDRLIFSDVSYQDGKPLKKLQEKQSFIANVQPIEGRELLLVPEHQRFKENYWCYTQEKVIEKTGEVVLRKGIHYQVQDIEYWGSYQALRIMRVDIGPYSTP